MDVHVVRCLSDNFSYIVVDRASSKAAVVDAVEPAKVAKAVAAVGASIEFVLTTHKHYDHADGNPDWAKSGLEIYGGKGDNCPSASVEVGDGDVIGLGAITFSVLHTPGHTAGHVCYVASMEGQPDCVFTGDTLFVGGCGRFFEGTPQQMHDSFAKLCALPDDTLCYVGHE